MVVDDVAEVVVIVVDVMCIAVEDLVDVDGIVVSVVVVVVCVVEAVVFVIVVVVIDVDVRWRKGVRALVDSVVCAAVLLCMCGLPATAITGTTLCEKRCAPASIQRVECCCACVRGGVHYC